MLVLRPNQAGFAHEFINKNRLAHQIEYPVQGGMLVHYKEHPLPERVFPFPEAFFSIDAVKAAITSATHLLKDSFWVKVATLAVVLLPGMPLGKIIKHFFTFTHKTLHKINFKPEFQHWHCQSARELMRAARRASIKFCKTDDGRATAERIIMTVCLIWEFDNAYRYRGQDAAAAFNQTLFLRHPFKATWALCDAIAARENGDPLKKKWQMTKLGATIFLLNPKIRRALKLFVENLDMQQLVMDASDKYWAFFFCDYNFDGLTREQRVLERNKVGWPIHI